MSSFDPMHSMRELPELPRFSSELRARMEGILHYGKPALSIDDTAWRGLYSMLAAYQRDFEESAAYEAATAALPGKNRRDVERTVLRPLRKAQAGLSDLSKTPAIRERVERASGDSSVAELLAEAIRTIEEAMREDNRPAPAFADDAIGRLEENLRAWWDARSRARSGGGKTPSGGGSVPAYNQFLELCFGVLSNPPGHAYDALRKYRSRREQNEQFWRRLADKLKALADRVEMNR